MEKVYIGQEKTETISKEIIDLLNYNAKDENVKAIYVLCFDDGFPTIEINVVCNYDDKKHFSHTLNPQSYREFGVKFKLKYSLIEDYDLNKQIDSEHYDLVNGTIIYDKTGEITKMQKDFWEQDIALYKDSIEFEPPLHILINDETLEGQKKLILIPNKNISNQ